jgi:hypothetical protein
MGSRRAAAGGACDARDAGAVHRDTTGFPLRYTRSVARTGPRRCAYQQPAAARMNKTAINSRIGDERGGPSHLIV